MTRQDRGLTSNRENPSRPDGPTTWSGLVDPAAKRPRAPLPQAILIDRACTRFENAWRQSVRERLEAVPGAADRDHPPRVRRVRRRPDPAARGAARPGARAAPECGGAPVDRKLP